MNDWIEWKGGYMPVDGETLVNLRYSDSLCPHYTDDMPVTADVAKWEHIGSDGDIVAYRLHKDA